MTLGGRVLRPWRQKHPHPWGGLLAGTTGAAASATCATATASAATGAAAGTGTRAGTAARTAGATTVGARAAWHRIGASTGAIARTGTGARRGGGAIGTRCRGARGHHAVIGRRSPRSGRLLRRGGARSRRAGIRNGRQNGTGQQAAEYEGRNLHLVHCRHLSSSWCASSSAFINDSERSLHPTGLRSTTFVNQDKRSLFCNIPTNSPIQGSASCSGVTLSLASIRSIGSTSRMPSSPYNSRACSPPAQ